MSHLVNANTAAEVQAVLGEFPELLLLSEGVLVAPPGADPPALPLDPVRYLAVPCYCPPMGFA